MDAAAAPGIEEIVVLKGAQVGWSEATRNILGYWIDLDPGPTLIVMPDQKSSEDLTEERIKPLLNNTPVCRKHLTAKAWDIKRHSIRLDTMSIFMAWAGSSQAMKSRPIRYVILEEPDEYPPQSGTSGDPISKAIKRTTTYADKGRSRILIGGTPTTRYGNVWKRWEMCGDQRYFWVPCPHCGKYQQLIWKRVRWPELDGLDAAKKSNKIISENLAYYECEHCNEKILDHQKTLILRRGVWAGADQAVTPDGRVVGDSRVSRRVGFFLSSLYSPWVTFSTLAGEFILAKDDRESLMDFINQRLAEPFEETTAKLEDLTISAKIPMSGPPSIVPKWAQAVVMTVDTQKDHFWYVIRAWGFNEQSQLVRYGVASTVHDLYQLAFKDPLPMEGGGMIPICGLLIDRAGGREAEIDNFVFSDPIRIRPVFGAAKGWKGWPIAESPHHKISGALIWKLDTDQLKAQLLRLITDPDPKKWLPHNQINADYCKQLASEELIYDPKVKDLIWKKRGPNHLWDCEVYQCAAARQIFLGLVPNEVEPAPKKSAKSVSDSINSYKGKW